MAGLLSKLVNRKQYQIIKGPLIALTIIGVIVCFGLFSSEQFFGQLETSRTLVQFDKLLIELESLEAELNNMQVQELSYLSSETEEMAEQFSRSCEVVRNHLSDVQLILQSEPNLSAKFEGTTKTIEEQIDFSQELVKKYRADKKTPLTTDRNRESELLKSAHLSLANMIGSQTRLAQSYLDRIQNATVTALICIMVFRTAMIMVFFIALLFAHRYLFEKKRMETLLAGVETKFSAIFETALDGIFTLSTEGQIESANAAMLKMFGREEDELIGKNITSVMPEFFSEKEVPLHSSTLKHDEKKIISPLRETTGHHKDGRSIPVELTVNKLDLADHQILSGIVRDITERKQAQQRLKDFYSTVSHELRTPLTSIRTALGLIEQGVVGPLTSETGPVLQIAQSEADRLIRMINDLLDIRKIEEGKFSLRLGNAYAKPLIETAIAAVSNLAKESKVELVSEITCFSAIYCDSDRIVQVLTNFLSNAIKFSSADNKVITSAEEVDGKVLFAVIDFGVGITEDQLPQLFGRFEQLDSTSDRTKYGSGLGLFISKTIIEYHNGTIGVDISAKEQTRFWFELPISERT
jgi:two-component system, LuxR family, sensor kinase FixL